MIELIKALGWPPVAGHFGMGWHGCVVIMAMLAFTMASITEMIEEHNGRLKAMNERSYNHMLDMLCWKMRCCI